MPIDYSKWDNLDEYSSSSDNDNDDGNDESLKNARVTRLDGPSTVTFGGGQEDNKNSATIRPSASANAETSFFGSSATLPSDLVPKKKALQATIMEDSTTSTSSDHIITDTPSWQEKGGMASIITSSSRKRRLYWSQGRYSVLLRLELFDDEKVKTVKLHGAVSYRDRFCAVSSSRPTIQVVSSTTTTTTSTKELLLEGEFPHAVHFAEDDEEGNEIEWEVERSANDERFLTITLNKAVPVQDVAVWWRRPLMALEEIDIGASETTTGSSQSFQQAWEEAHKVFKQRRQPSNS